ncbi:MAG: hypothetical protein KDD94_07645 [Calditrichaeota bacterium]|nr:hypothetical protein [Calditrichota bacterium]
MKQYLIDLLYQSFDRELTEKESDDLELGLQTFPELREKKESIEQLRESLADFKEFSAFSDGFANRVMGKINATKALKKADILLFNSINHSFKRIAIAALFLIVSLFAINMFNRGDISIPSQSNQQTIEDEIESSLADLF